MPRAVHTGKPEGDPGEGAGGWESESPFNLGHIERRGEWAHGTSLQHGEATFLGAAPGASRLQSLTKAAIISLSDLQLQQDQPDSCFTTRRGR